MEPPKYGVMLFDTTPKKEESEEDFLVYMYPTNKKWSKVIEATKNVLITTNEAVFDMYNKKTSLVLLEDEKETLVSAFRTLTPTILLVLVTREEVVTSKLVNSALSQELGNMLDFLIQDIEQIVFNKNETETIDTICRKFFERYFASDHFTKTFFTTLNGVPIRPLPSDVVSKISKELNGFEGNTNSHKFNENPRPCLIVGTCLFGNGVLVESHLPFDITRKIQSYLEYTNLLSRRKENSEAIIMEKVYFSQSQDILSNSKISSKNAYTLVILACEDKLLCSVLDQVVNMQGNSNPYYLEEMRRCMSEICKIDMETEVIKSHPHILYCKNNGWIVSNLGKESDKFVSNCHLLHEIFVEGLTDEMKIQDGMHWTVGKTIPDVGEFYLQIDGIPNVNIMEFAYLYSQGMIY